MDLATIEQNVGELDVTQGFDLIFDLLAAYGMPKASITRLRKGSANRSDRADEVLWKGKVYYRDLSDDPAAPDPHAVIDDAAGDERIAKQQPRFLIVRDRTRLLAVDRKTADSLDIPIEKLGLNAAFFMPWAGVEKAQLETAHYADIKAAEKMARLYDEIRKVNSVEGDEEIHALNVFFTRLLFCFFAEDTGIFEDGQVTKAIASLTHQDGSDLHHFLGRLFETLDTPLAERGDMPSYLADFGYVNGSLFAQRTGIPEFSPKARSIILECAELDWSEISPDIFGSMMQAVVSPRERSGLGMHYTSVDNVLKVLRPLFLDELEHELEEAHGSTRKLHRLLNRIAAIRVFDPACGSGNFLVVAYRELRELEMRLLAALRDAEVTRSGSGLFDVSRVDLRNFCGLEIDDFACEIARLSLWIAKHQINRRYVERFAAFPPLIPLTESGHITCGNAVRVAWELACPPRGEGETFICGNPPYAGFKNQTAEQKADIAGFAGPAPFPKRVDYVGLWFVKAADFIASHGGAAAFVATSSVTQGDQVGQLFPLLQARGMTLFFAHQPFPWTNSARGQAGVSCVVVGFRTDFSGHRRLYGDHGVKECASISPYLRPGPPTVVAAATVPPCGLPRMAYGNMPLENGHLVLAESEYLEILATAPEAAPFLRKYVGSHEFLNGVPKFCIWVPDDACELAWEIPALAERFDLVRKWRAASKSGAASADAPWRFHQRCHQDTTALVVPIVSSERRPYVPLGFVGPETIVSNAAQAIYGAESWTFGLIQSRAHMAWLRAVGGRLDQRLRYSSSLVYNTFPLIPSGDGEREAIADAALGVLLAREMHPGSTLAELYDRDEMPSDLRIAHDTLDSLVDNLLLGAHAPLSDDERIERLLTLYVEMHSDATHA